MSNQYMQAGDEEWNAKTRRLRERYGHTLEAAINDHSCTLACFVSLCRDKGATFGQQQIIEQYRHKYDEWKQTPGSMTLDRLTNFVMGTTTAKALIVSPYAETILAHWRKPSCIGAFVNTGKQPTSQGWVKKLHCWRLLECSETELVLMNPTRPQADILVTDWNFMKSWQGYAAIFYGDSLEAQGTVD